MENSLCCSTEQFRMTGDSVQVGSMPRTGPSLAIGGNLKPTGAPRHKTVRASNLSRMIAARIRIVREARGMTQDDLEDRSGLSHGVLSRVESGARGRQLSIDLVVAVAKGLRCDLLFLITGQGRIPFGAGDETKESRQQELAFSRSAPPTASRKSETKPRKAPPPRPRASRNPSSPSPERSKPARRAAGKPVPARVSKRQHPPKRSK